MFWFCLVWTSPKTILSLIGVLSLGIGDSLVSDVGLFQWQQPLRSKLADYGCTSQASIVGKRIGRTRWSMSGGKTVEGSVAFFVSMSLAGIVLSLTGLLEEFSVRCDTAI